MTRFRSLIIGALGLGVAALSATAASAQGFRHGGHYGGYHGGHHGYHGGYHRGGHGHGGFWPAALAVGALTGAIGAIASPAYGYSAYPAYEPYPAYGAYPYPAYEGYPVTYVPVRPYYARSVYKPRRVIVHRRVVTRQHAYARHDRGVMRVSHRVRY